MEINSEVNALKLFLRTQYASLLRTPGVDVGLPDEDILDNLIWDIREAVSSNNSDRCMNQDADFVQEVFDVLQAYDINPVTIVENNRILQYAMKLKNAERMWINRGYSPNEMLQLMPGRLWKEMEVLWRNKVYPNALCPCGWGRKYKKCCGRR